MKEKYLTKINKKDFYINLYLSKKKKISMTKLNQVLDKINYQAAYMLTYKQNYIPYFIFIILVSSHVFDVLTTNIIECSNSNIADNSNTDILATSAKKNGPDNPPQAGATKGAIIKGKKIIKKSGKTLWMDDAAIDKTLQGIVFAAAIAIVFNWIITWIGGPDQP